MRASLTSPAMTAFPDLQAGRLPHYLFRGLLNVHSRYGLHTRAATNSWHAYPKASDISSPPCLLRLLPAGAVAGWGLHPLEKRRLCTAHAISGSSRPAALLFFGKQRDLHSLQGRPTAGAAAGFVWIGAAEAHRTMASGGRAAAQSESARRRAFQRVYDGQTFFNFCLNCLAVKWFRACGPRSVTMTALR